MMPYNQSSCFYRKTKTVSVQPEAVQYFLFLPPKMAPIASAAFCSG